MTTKLHRGKTLYLSAKTAGVVDPLCRDVLAEADSGAYGTSHGASWNIWPPARASCGRSQGGAGTRCEGVRTARTRLEAAGAIVSSQIRTDVRGGHRHSSLIGRWDQAGVPASKAGMEDALAAAVVAGVHAAVIVERVEPPKWFAWSVDAPLLEALLETRRLVAVDERSITAAA